MGSEVVVGTCPDLGTIRPIAQPLRYVARRLSRNLAAAQTIAVVEAGGRTVSLGDLLGPLFAERVDLFSDDKFHPSAEGYAEAADALLPSVLDALGLYTTAVPRLRLRCAGLGRSLAQPPRRPRTRVPRSPRLRCTANPTAGAAVGRESFVASRPLEPRTSNP